MKKMTREEAIEAIKEAYGNTEYSAEIIKALGQEFCISRQALKEQMLKYGFHAPDMTVTEFVEDLLSISSQKPCEDTISRQATVEFLESHAETYTDARVRIAFKAAASLVNNSNNLPSVTS